MTVLWTCLSKRETRFLFAVLPASRESYGITSQVRFTRNLLIESNCWVAHHFPGLTFVDDIWSRHLTIKLYFYLFPQPFRGAPPRSPASTLHPIRNSPRPGRRADCIVIPPSLTLTTLDNSSEKPLKKESQHAKGVTSPERFGRGISGALQSLGVKVVVPYNNHVNVCFFLPFKWYVYPCALNARFVQNHQAFLFSITRGSSRIAATSQLYLQICSSY